MKHPKISRRAETRPYGRVSAPTGNCRKFLTQLRAAVPDPCARDGVHAADPSGTRIRLPVLEGFPVDLGQPGTNVKARFNRVHDTAAGARRPPRARMLSDSPSRPQKGGENTRIPALRGLFKLATRHPMPVPNAPREKHHFRLGYEKSGPGKTTRCLTAITTPIFGYKNHVSMDRTYGFIRHSAVTDASCHDGAMLCVIWSPVIIRHRRSGGGYGLSFASQRSVWLADQGLVSRIHHQKAAHGAVRPHHRVSVAATKIGH